MITVRYERGLELPDLGLWLDPVDPKSFAFVSHAHSDHLGAHAEVIVSPGTSALMKARQPGRRVEHVLEFGVPEAFQQYHITLLPAGHIFGSAQALVECAAGSLLYTGDFKLRHGLSSERVEWRGAETLVMETTYGLPRYAMPSTEQTLEQMVEFCRDAIEEEAVPVLLGYSLGKAQEILCALIKAGLMPMLHGSVFRLTEIYRALQPDFPGSYLPYDASNVSGKVLVCPPSANRTRMVTQIKRRRVAVLTGWAMDPGAVYRYQCDAAFPLTDHADYPDLIRYVELVKPKRVLTLHGFAAEFARDLRERGMEAWPLTEGHQLELTLGRTSHTRSAPGAQPQPEVSTCGPNCFATFASAGEQIGATASKLRKTEVLANYLRSLDPESLPIAAVYLTGRAFPQSDPRVLQTGWAIIRRAIMGVTAIGETRFREISRSYADAGKATFEAFLDRSGPQSWTLGQSRQFFAALADARGPVQKGELLRTQLADLTPLEASYLVRILTGDLRIGLKEGLVEDAVASAFDVVPDDVREANMLTGDLGHTASLASRRTLHTASLRLFHPIKVMLASPEPTAAAIWQRLSPEGAPHSAWAEDKFDGIRAHLHVGDGRVEIFTRDLRRVTGQFADLTRAAAEFGCSAIFDGEILAFEEGRNLTFHDLQRRLGRKTEDDLFLGATDVPVVCRVFDLLWLNGESLLRLPLSARRSQLEALALPEKFHRAPRFEITGAAQLDEIFRAARLRKNEGLIIKDATSLYTPGRRGLAWLKLKKELSTLDVVVVAAEQGHGKRAHVLSDYTFAVRDDDTGALLTIGKAYSGLTDAEIEELTEHFLATTIAQHGGYREVHPQIVLEIAFDKVQPSTRHGSGLALRFPRIKAIRRDKTPADIDTLGFARSLVEPGLNA